jgi:hypothetical protein
MSLIPSEPEVRHAIARRGFAWLPRSAWTIAPDLQPHWQCLGEDWHHLEPDRFLKNGAMFRLRRYGRYHWSPSADTLTPLPAEPYFQPELENVYAGGIARDFAPLLPGTVHNPFLHALVRDTFACLPITSDRQQRAWEVRIHQIRIVAAPGVPGLPAPEGIHQDGTDFLTLHLVRRRNVVGGESTIYHLSQAPLQHYTLREPLDSLILEDPRILHGVTSVHSADGLTPGVRDLLGVDFIDSLAQSGVSV